MKTAPDRDLRETLRDEMVMKDRIFAALADGPKTVIEIAETLAVPAHEAMFWVMGLRRYGRLAEVGGPNEEGYCQYKLSEQPGA